jgi:hypothetical protein
MILACFGAFGCGMSAKNVSIAMEQGDWTLPTNCEKKIKDYMQDVLFDPPAAIYKFYGAPEKGFYTRPYSSTITHVGWVVTFTINGKNRMGGYTGPKVHRAIFVNNEVFSIDDEITYDRDLQRNVGIMVHIPK